LATEQPKNLRELLAQLDAQGITDYRRYRQVRQFLGFKAREKNIPLSGTFELTPLCNLDCKMCYVHLNREQMQGAELLSVETWKDIMHQAVDAGMMFARLTGGECLTYPGFKELYCYLQSLGVEVSVLSNGILMNEEMVDFFKQNPPPGVQVTLYGASEDAYERVTGYRVFERVLNNVRCLRDAGIPLSMAVTPNAFMTDGTDIVQLLHDEGFYFSINSGLMAPRKETGRKVADAGLDTYVAMLRLQYELNGKDIGPQCDPDSLPDPPTKAGTTERGVRCGAGRSAFSIDWQGKMRPCNTFPCEPVDVLKHGFAESWQHVNHIALNFLRPAECEACQYSSVCKHCVSEHAAGAEVGHASPAVCQYGKRMVAEGIRQLSET
jgi:radical SAM protein with 4Fe4S-binding SPASM domain